MQDQMQPTDLTPTPPPKRLHRSADNKMLLGVCGGLADYFDLDATLIRVLFAVGTLTAGSTVLAYIVLAVVMPSSEMLDARPRDAARGTFNEAAGEVRTGIGWAKERLPGRKK